MQQNEIWKDINNYEGIYQISNFGRVKSLSRYIYNGSGERFQPELIREIQINNKRNGYCEISLHKDSFEKRYRINRLVAEAFISNPNNLPEVNHKDGNKLNNNVDNLEWITSKGNKKHAWDNNLYKRKIELDDYLFVYCLNKYERVYQKHIAKYYDVWETAIERVVRYVREHQDIYSKNTIINYYKSNKFKEQLNEYRKNINAD